MKKCRSVIAHPVFIAMIMSLVFFAAYVPESEAQVYSITGSVKDASNNAALQGAVVTLRDSASPPVSYNAPATDVSGNFAITLPGPGDYAVFDAVLAGYSPLLPPSVPITLTEQSRTAVADTIYMSAGQEAVLSLALGWNLVSLPLTPTDTAIATVLTPIAGNFTIVWAYINGTWQKYQPNKPSDLLTMEPGYGYWIKTTAEQTLTVSGTDASKTIPLGLGWNLIGFVGAGLTDTATALTSVANKYSIVWGYSGGTWQKYQPAKPSDLTQLGPGYGYWIKTTEAASLVYP